MKHFAFITLIGLCLFATSCSKEKEEENDGWYIRTADEMEEHFDSYFFFENGIFRGEHLEGFVPTEWVMGARSGESALEAFKDITGMDIRIRDIVGPYNYKFLSSDGQSDLGIEGSLEAGEDNEYAILTVNIPKYPQIQTIHLCNKAYFQNLGLDPHKIWFVY